MANCYLAILKRPYLSAILAGTKTIELRLGKVLRPALANVQPGDRLALKLAGGPVCALADVAKVELHLDLTPRRIEQLRQRYNPFIRGPAQYWQSKADARYAVLIWLESVRSIEPIRIAKKDMRAWVQLTAGRDFGLRDPIEALDREDTDDTIAGKDMGSTMQ